MNFHFLTLVMFVFFEQDFIKMRTGMEFHPENSEIGLFSAVSNPACHVLVEAAIFSMEGPPNMDEVNRFLRSRELHSKNSKETPTLIT